MPEATKGSSCQLGFVSMNYTFHKLGLHKVCGEVLAFEWNKSYRVGRPF